LVGSRLLLDRANPSVQTGGRFYHVCPQRSCRTNIVGPLASRKRASCAPGGRRIFMPSGRSQPPFPLVSMLGQRTQPKVCGAPNTIFDVSFFIWSSHGWEPPILTVF
jgi:hypothetical protein